ncbi:diguanylate cyclase domain-containing protein [Megalodesulfovibrio paquesii]
MARTPLPTLPSLSLRALLVAISVSLVSLCAGLLLLIVSHIATSQVKDDVGRYLAEQSYAYADKLDRDMWSRAKEIEVLSRLEVFQELTDLDELETIIQQLHAAIPAYAWIGVLDMQGRVLVSSNNILKGQSIASRPVFHEALDGLFVGDVHDAVLLANLLPNPTGEAMKFVDIAMPIQDEANRTIGVLATHLSWSWVNEIDKSIFQNARDDQIELFVVASDGTVILGPKESMGHRLDFPILQANASSGRQWTIQQWPDGGQYLTGAALADGHLSYAGLGWTVLARQPLVQAYSHVARMEYVILGIGLFFAGLVAALGAASARWVTRPLSGLVEVARRLRRGVAVVFPPYAGIREIEELYAALQEMLSNLTSTRAERDDMMSLAFEDKLTRLPNRRAFEDRIARLQSQPPRRNQLQAILFLDLDGFKHVNDTLGHDAGDLVLQAIAIRLQGSLRTGDTVYRLGGDEFVILSTVEYTQAEAETNTLADRILRAVNLPLHIKDTPVHVGCSMGASFFPAHSPHAAEVVHFADAALYTAKLAGKNRLKLHEPAAAQVAARESMSR